MKKSLVFILIAAFSLFVFSDKINAQGIYSEKVSEESEESSKSSGISKALTLPTGDAGEEDDPIGEGILILSALAGGYTLVKKRKLSKKRGYEA